MTQNATVTAKTEEFKRLFDALSKDNQDRALTVLRALVFAQGAVSGQKESA